MLAATQALFCGFFGLDTGKKASCKVASSAFPSSQLASAADVLQGLRRRRRKVTEFIQPAEAYEDESVMLSGPH